MIVSEVKRLAGRRQPTGDRGITVVFFAIGLTAMLTVGALVLGGSVGYTAARNAQTAADAAALAGTGLLQEHKQDWVTTPGSAVASGVRSVVEDNGAALVACDLVDAQYAITEAEDDVIAPCDRLEFLDQDDFADVAGVRVSVADTRDVPFNAFVDQDTITGGAVAAATIQAVTSGRAPFMVCASPDATGHPARIVVEDQTDPTGYRVNEAAIGKLYVLWGNQIKYGGRSCGNPSSDWRGLVKFGATFAVPSASATSDSDWWQSESGNSGGNLPGTLAGGSSCELEGQKIDALASQVGCLIAVPLCPKSNGSTSDFRLYCVKIGAFQITHVGSVFSESTTDTEYDTPCGTVTDNIICGRFIGTATAVGGQGVAERPDPYSISVIKLVQ
jgi:hypothetical protein